MKKLVSIVLLSGLLVLTLSGCGQKVPFQAENAEGVEVYRFVVPASAEKKVVTNQEDVKDICEQLLSAGMPKDGESLVGGTVISFRVNLNDGTAYELICVENTSENFEDFEAIWNDIDCEATAAKEVELPTGN